MFTLQNIYPQHGSSDTLILPMASSVAGRGSRCPYVPDKPEANREIDTNPVKNDLEKLAGGRG